MGSICSEEQLIDWMERYGNLVYSVCMKLTGDAAASEDLSQETFLAAYREADRFDGTSEKAWLCRIASNKSIDYLRRISHCVLSDGEEHQEAPAQNACDPLHRVLEREADELLLRYIDGLDPRYRETARLYFIKGCTAREIAEKTGENTKTVQTHILRSRQKLRDTYGKELRENGYTALSG